MTVVTVASAVVAAVFVAPAGAATGTDLCAVYPNGHHLVGTAGADLMVGTAGADALSGGSGDDTIVGCGGDDVLRGLAGDDLLIGGPGDDSVDGGSGNDTIQSGELETFGGATSVPIVGTKNRVSIQVAAGNVRDINVRLNMVHARPQDVLVKLVSPFTVASRMTDVNCGGGTTNACGPGTFSSSSSPQTGVSFDSEAIISIQKSGLYDRNLNGRFHPKDSLDGPYRNSEACNGTNCTWTLEITDRVANGINGSVTYAALDIQYPQGQDGTDTLNGGYGNNDTISMTERDGAITYTGNDNLANDGEAGEGDNARSSIEWVYTGWGADVITGNGANNDIRTGQGNDRISGLGGNDRFRAGNGDDWMDGGLGTDKLDGNTGRDICLNGELLLSCQPAG